MTLASFTEACKQVTLRSFRVVDTGNASAAAQCFTDDALLSRYGEHLTGRAALTAFFADRERDTHRTTCHVVSNFAAVTVGDGTGMEASYSLLVFEVSASDPELRLVGIRTCFDRYRQVGDRWAISYRKQEHFAHAPAKPEPIS